MQTIHKDDLDRKIKLNEVEAFTYAQLQMFVNENNSLIEKSEGSKEDIQKAIVDEIKSFSPIKVISANSEGHLQEDFMFVRAAQILWDEPKEGEIQKSRGGTYMNTPENMKLGRVGAKYGASGKSEEQHVNKPRGENDEAGSIPLNKVRNGMRCMYEGRPIVISEKITYKEHAEIAIDYLDVAKDSKGSGTNIMVEKGEKSPFTPLNKEGVHEDWAGNKDTGKI